jgi:hypothetical protein
VEAVGSQVQGQSGQHSETLSPKKKIFLIKKRKAQQIPALSFKRN